MNSPVKPAVTAMELTPLSVNLSYGPREIRAQNNDSHPAQTLARLRPTVNRFVRGGVMQQAVPSRPVHPYLHVQTLQASWPRVWIDRAFHTFTLRLPGFLMSRAGRLPELVIRSM